MGTALGGGKGNGGNRWGSEPSVREPVRSEDFPSSERLRSSSESRDFEIDVAIVQLAIIELHTTFVVTIIKKLW
jgi:hypothetical protein